MLDFSLPQHDPTFKTAIVAEAICALLDGGAPNGTEPEQCGEWADVVSQLYGAHAAGGAAQVRRTFDALGKAHPDLIALVAGGPPKRRTRWTAEELLATEFPDPISLIVGFLVVGLSYLAGRPKLGKSWMALQLAIAVATGGKFLGVDAERAKVLYLALEDNARRIKNRARLQGMPPSADITFETDWEPFGAGGLAKLMHTVQAEGYRLIIIDTLSRALAGMDQMDGEAMGSILGSLQRFAVENNISILLVDHHRKAGAETVQDLVDSVSGATAKTAVADAVWGLFRARGQREATLKITGRDLEDREVVVNFDQTTACWQLVGDAAQVRQDTMQGSILHAMAENFDGDATVSDLAGFLERKKQQVSREVAELCAKGMLVRGDKKGREVPYSLTPSGKVAAEKVSI